MSKKVNFNQAMTNAGISLKIGRAVVRQLGYTTGNAEECGHNLSDIARHGIQGGYCGFIYYTDTNAFYKKNRKEIVRMLEDMASDLGEGVIEMVAGFNCFKGLYGDESRDLTAEIARAIYGRVGKNDYHQVPNALAWYAAEEVARAWVDKDYR